MLTKTNIAEVIDLLTAAYGDKAFPAEPAQRVKVVNLWSVMFADDDPAEVLIAVKNCIATLQFPPKIADIKHRIAANRMAGQMTEMEAWCVIRKAVEDATSRTEANRLYEAMPPILKRVVGSPSMLRAWRSIDDAQFETVTASNCMRTYRELATREAGYYALPADMQQAESWRLPEPPRTELPKPVQPRYELPPEWDRTREVSDNVKARLADFTGGEQ